ncbi:MAG: hypothetical protein IIV14_00405 [Bacteroidaceae bacterium]|nr:hypothetical protein [Bacteroidaceae bacterium]
MNIAICVVAYNRLFSLKRLLSSLDDSEYPFPVKLYISVDKSDVDTVIQYVKTYHWRHGELEIISHKRNLGLRKHILSCGDLLKKHDALVVLEDDIVVSPGFMLYATATINEYINRNDIAGISLYSFQVNYHSCQPFCPLREESDVFLMQNAQSWGQIWLKKQWEEFKAWYAENNEDFSQMDHLPKSICNWSNRSWLKYHTRYCIERNKYFVYPYTSYTTCFSDNGEHIQDETPIFQTHLNQSREIYLRFSPTVQYDTYFENSRIYEWLGLTKEELCVDYYGDNGNRLNRRYWLSRLILPYKIIKSYGLRMRPYELNIKYDIPGNVFFLYDTNIKYIPEYTPKVRQQQFFYMYGTQFVDIESFEIDLRNTQHSNQDLQRLNENLQNEIKTLFARRELEKRRTLLLVIAFSILMIIRIFIKYMV